MISENAAKTRTGGVASRWSRQLCHSAAEDARLFHTLEIIGMLASYRVLLSKLNILKASHARLQNGSFSGGREVGRASKAATILQANFLGSCSDFGSMQTLNCWMDRV